MGAVKVKYSRFQIFRDIAFSIAFTAVSTYFFLDIINNYGTDEFPRRLMRFSKEFLIMATTFLEIVSLVLIVISFKFLFKCFKTNVALDINSCGIYFYYHPLTQKKHSYIEWGKVESIKLISKDVVEAKILKRKVKVKENIIAIKVIDLDIYIESCDATQRKYINKSIKKYNSPVAFCVNAIDKKPEDIYNIIIQYWNEWKKNNAKDVE